MTIFVFADNLAPVIQLSFLEVMQDSLFQCPCFGWGFSMGSIILYICFRRIDVDNVRNAAAHWPYNLTVSLFATRPYFAHYMRTSWTSLWRRCLIFRFLPPLLYIYHLCQGGRLGFDWQLTSEGKIAHISWVISFGFKAGRNSPDAGAITYYYWDSNGSDGHAREAVQAHGNEYLVHRTMHTYLFRACVSKSTFLSTDS